MAKDDFILNVWKIGWKARRNIPWVYQNCLNFLLPTLTQKVWKMETRLGCEIQKPKPFMKWGTFKIQCTVKRVNNFSRFKYLVTNLTHTHIPRQHETVVFYVNCSRTSTLSSFQALKQDRIWAVYICNAKKPQNMVYKIYRLCILPIYLLFIYFIIFYAKTF